jgi:hypothetical protein
MDNPQTEVTIAYDCRGGRAVKVFTDPFAARRFYAAQVKAGNNPTIQAKKV